MISRDVDVDITSLCSIAHQCTGCKKSALCCCSRYEVCLSEEEIERLVVWMPEAAKYASHLRSGSGYVNVFEELDDGLFSMDTTDSGRCVFAYQKADACLCSLHSVAIDFALPLREMKPVSCLLWPLSVSEGQVKTIFVQDDALDFLCNRRQRKKRRALDGAVVHILKTVFGKRFTDDVKAAVSRGNKTLRIKLPDGLHV